MDKKTLATITKKLKTEKEQLGKELAGFTRKDTKIKDDENAAEVATYSDRLSLEHALEKQLRDVNKALANMAKKSYGICKYCGKSIEEKRLVIRPTSSSCVACKKRLKGEE